MDGGLVAFPGGAGAAGGGESGTGSGTGSVCSSLKSGQSATAWRHSGIAAHNADAPMATQTAGLAIHAATIAAAAVPASGSKGNAGAKFCPTRSIYPVGLLDTYANELSPPLSPMGSLWRYELPSRSLDRKNRSEERAYHDEDAPN